MNIEKIREQMEGLWRETFGDTSDYVKLVFDRYFTPERIAYRADGDKVVSALLSVPYTFHSPSGRDLRGLYLCGLATKKEKRGSGLMTELIEETNRKAKEEGFDFSFLIPSDERNRIFYGGRGYKDAFYKLKQYFVKGHKFGAQDGYKFAIFDGSDKEDVINYLSGSANDNADFGKEFFEILHSREDWDAVLKEAELSHLPVGIVRKEDKVCGVAFLSFVKKDNIKAIEIRKVFCNGSEAETALLQGIADENPDYSIVYVNDVSDIYRRNSTSQLWQPFREEDGVTKPENEYEDVSVSTLPYDPLSQSYPYGMIRIFNFHDLIEKIGIADYSSLKGYTVEELSTILMRKPSMNNGETSLNKLLGLPEINLSIFLLLE